MDTSATLQLLLDAHRLKRTPRTGWVTRGVPDAATGYFPPEAKPKAEAKVLSELLRRLPGAEHWNSWWQEFEKGTSIEGQLVRDADRLDMLIQAHVYEQTTGNRWLEEFWPRPADSPFQFSAAQALYEELRALRRRPAT